MGQDVPILCGFSLHSEQLRTIRSSQSWLAAPRAGAFLSASICCALRHCSTPANPSFERLYRMHHSLFDAEAAAQVHASCYREHKTTYRLEGAELIEGANSAHVRKVVEEARGMRSGLRGRLIAAMNQYDFDVWLTLRFRS